MPAESGSHLTLRMALGVAAGLLTMTALSLLELVLPAELSGWLATRIAAGTPALLQGAPLQLGAAVVIGVGAFKLSEPLAVWLAFRLSRFDDAVLGRIGQAKPFDPLRGVDVATHLDPELAAALIDPRKPADAAGQPKPARGRRLVSFPLPFPEDWPRSERNPARRLVVEALTDFVRPSGATVDFSWTVLAGGSGLGKSRIAVEFARHLARRDRLGGDQPKATRRERAFYRVKAFFHRFAAGDPWDAGWLGATPPRPGQALTPRQERKRLTDSQIERLKTWRPRKPTFLILDDPVLGDAARVVAALGHVAVERIPIRLLIVAPGVPDQLGIGMEDRNWRTGTSGFQGQAIVMSDAAGFDAADLRAVTGAQGFADWLPKALLDLSPQTWGVPQTATIETLIANTGGNPFLVELALVALWRGRQLDAIDGPKLLAERAERVLDAARSAGFDTPDHLELAAAATLAGGADDIGPAGRKALLASFPGASLPRDAASDVLARVYPQDAAAGLDLTERLPPMRPRLIGLAFVRKVIAGDDDRDAAARRIVTAAWRAAPRAVLRAALSARGGPEPEDALGRALSIEPPPDAAIDALSLAKAYIDEAVLVPRLVWDRGCEPVAPGLWQDAKARCMALSPADASQAIDHLIAIVEPDRKARIVRGREAVVLLMTLAGRMAEAGNEALGPDPLARLWEVLDTLVSIDSNWGCLLDQSDSDAGIVAAGAAELWRSASRIASSDAVIARLRARLPDLMVLGWRTGMLSPLIDLLSPVVREGDDETAELLLLLSELNHRSRVVEVAIERGLILHPTEPTLISRIERALNLIKIRSGPDQHHLRIACIAASLRIFTHNILDSRLADIAALLSQLPAREAATWHWFTVAESFVARSEREWVPALRQACGDLEHLVGNDAAMSELSYIHHVAQITCRMIANDELSEELSRASLAAVMSLSQRPEATLWSLFWALNADHSAALRDTDSAHIEGESFKSRQAQTVKIFLDSRDVWAGQAQFEIKFLKCLTSWSRAGRDNCAHTRDIARRIERHGRSLPDHPVIESTVADAWRIHAWALSQRPGQDILMELEVCVARVETLYARSAGDWQAAPLAAGSAAEAYSYLVRARTGRGLDAARQVAKVILFATREGSASKFDLVREGFAHISQNAVTSPEVQALARWHLGALNSIAEGQNRAEPPTGDVDSEPVIALNRAMIDFLAMLVRCSAPVMPRQAVAAHDCLLALVALSGLGAEAEVAAQVEQALAAVQPALTEVRSGAFSVRTEPAALSFPISAGSYVTSGAPFASTTQALEIATGARGAGDGQNPAARA